MSSKIENVLLETTPLNLDVIKNIMSFAYSDKERWTRNNFKWVMREFQFMVRYHDDEGLIFNEGITMNLLRGLKDVREIKRWLLSYLNPRENGTSIRLLGRHFRHMRGPKTLKNIFRVLKLNQQNNQSYHSRRNTHPL
jgi:hypothetical protein